GWQVEQVSLSPANLLRNWRVISEKGQARLIVDLQEALAPTVENMPPSAQLTLRLQPNKPLPLAAGDPPLPFPQVLPLKVHVREAVLAISTDPLYEAEVNTSAAPAPKEDKGPWGRQLPEHCFSTRAQAVAGTLRLHPRRTHVRA